MDGRSACACGRSGRGGRDPGRRGHRRPRRARSSDAAAIAASPAIPSATPELIAIAEAAKAIGDWRLEGTTMVVTLEPCAMCAGALVNARVAKLIFGASDPKAGFCGSLGNLVQDARLNHRLEVVSGVEAERVAKASAGVLSRVAQAVAGSRRGGRVVERGGLENRYTFTGIGGSNPPLSASRARRGGVGWHSLRQQSRTNLHQRNIEQFVERRDGRVA